MKYLKKSLVILITIVMISAMMGTQVIWGNTVPEYDARATYCEFYNVPVMDGVIDSVWETSEAMWTDVRSSEDPNQALGYTKALWTENTLYLLGVVYDPTLDGVADESAGNNANFWVSETASSEAAYGTLPGDWGYSLTHANFANHFFGNDIRASVTSGAAVYPDGYYVVEATVPIQTPDLTFAAGDIIGYNFTILDDSDADGAVDMIATWKETWAAPSGCGKLLLVAEDLPQAQANYAYTIPTIDGEIDAIWDTTEAMNTEAYDNGDQASGYGKVLWDEDTLYLLAVVNDDTLAGLAEDNPANAANFWISETASSELGYGLVPGDWHYGINQAGTYLYYTGNDLESIAESAVTQFADFYVVEVAVPVQTDGFAFSEGHVIGFNVSIDDDADNDGVRDYYCTWQDHGVYRAYWACPEWVNKIELIQDYQELPSSNSSSETSSSQSSEAEPTESSSESPSTGDNYTWLIVVVLMGCASLALLPSRKYRERKDQ